MRRRYYAVTLVTIALLAALPVEASAVTAHGATTPVVHADNWPNCC